MWGATVISNIKLAMTAVCGKCGAVYWVKNGHSCSKKGKM